MKYQTYLPWDCSSLSNYLAWAQGIGTALSAVGWTKSSDTGQVTWANVASVPASTPCASNLGAVTAWSSGTAYSGNPNCGSGGAFSVVTNSGLTYACTLSTAVPVIQVIVNTSQSLTLSSVAGSNSGVTTYTGTITGGTSNAFSGFLFTITGFTNAVNNGTFLCTASSPTTLQLQTVTQSGSNITTVTETHAATAASSTANTAYAFSGSSSGAGSNGYYNHNFTVAGFTQSGNNGPVTCTYSSSVYMVVTTGSQINESHTATANSTDAPGSSAGASFWVGYNYEIWKSTDALSSTCPLYLRLVYGVGNFNNQAGKPGTVPALNITVGTGSTGTGWVNGNIFSSATAPTEFPNIAGFNVTNGLGNNTFECDFCVSTSGGSLSMCLWRNAANSSQFAPIVLVIDRAKDAFGNDLSTYATCLLSSYQNVGAYQLLFQPGINTTQPLGAASSSWPTIYSNQTSLQINGQAPVLPVFPTPGYVANPCLGAICMASADAVNGMLINTFMYGGTHTYIICSTEATVAAVGSLTKVGIRFE